MVTTRRSTSRLTNGIRGQEPVILEGCAHAPSYGKVPDLNERTLAFLRQPRA